VASLAWSATSALAQRIARPLGLAVGVVRRLVGLATEPVGGQPAGERAGDVLICQPATILHASPAHATPLPRERAARRAPDPARPRPARSVPRPGRGVEPTGAPGPRTSRPRRSPSPSSSRSARRSRCRRP
jgi:hypothetical protein